MNERFDELLPWYVNGSLSAEDRAWVDRYLAEHPEAQAELDWYRSLSARLQDNAPAVPETIGLAKAMTLIRGDRPSFAERVTAFFGAFGVRPVTAFAGLAIIALQGGFILNLLNTAQDAKEAEIRHLLMSVQGHLAGGPGQLGDYFVVVPAGKEAAVAEQLKSNPIVQAVSLAPGLPPRE
jgi:anti-sigma factor RsiW